MNVIKLDRPSPGQAREIEQLKSALTFLYNEAQRLNCHETAHFIGCGLLALRDQTSRLAS